MNTGNWTPTFFHVRAWHFNQMETSNADYLLVCETQRVRSKHAPQEESMFEVIITVSGADRSHSTHSCADTCSHQVSRVWRFRTARRMRTWVGTRLTSDPGCCVFRPVVWRCVSLWSPTGSVNRLTFWTDWLAVLLKVKWLLCAKELVVRGSSQNRPIAIWYIATICSMVFLMVRTCSWGVALRSWLALSCLFDGPSVCRLGEISLRVMGWKCQIFWWKSLNPVLKKSDVSFIQIARAISPQIYSVTFTIVPHVVHFVGMLAYYYWHFYIQYYTLAASENIALSFFPSAISLFWDDPRTTVKVFPQKGFPRKNIPPRKSLPPIIWAILYEFLCPGNSFPASNQ